MTIERTRRETVVGVLLILAIAIGAFAFRLPHLEQRPMHLDEAVHAIKLGELLEAGRYTYDPHDYHGPTIYYAALPFIRLSGVTTLVEVREWMMRIVPVLFGTALVLMSLLMIRPLGAIPAIACATLLAISPAFVFYSRYFIQEIPFVLFTFCALMVLSRSPLLSEDERHQTTWRWPVLLGLSFGLMHATKETCVLAWCAMATAWVPTSFSHHGRRDATAHFIDTLSLRNTLIVALVTLGTSALLISGFLTSPRGILDSWLTYGSYVHRADGVGMHDKPWYAYLQLLAYSKLGPGVWWSEGLILALAAVGGMAALLGKTGTACKRLARFFAFYTIILLAIYSIIPYKTPWCALSFLHGMIVLAGLGVATLLRLARYRWAQAIVMIALLAGAWHLGRQAHRSAYIYYADTRNPYVYGHTSTDAVRLAERIHEIAAVSPQGDDMPVAVIGPEYWPLPWYLRDMTKVGYWLETPDTISAPLVVVLREMADEVEPKLGDEYASYLYSIRPEILVKTFIRKDLWDAFLATRGAAK